MLNGNERLIHIAKPNDIGSPRSMRFIPLLLMTLVPAAAQIDVGKMISEGLQDMVVGLAPMPNTDKAEILKITADTLTKHMTFRQDGTASAICTASGRQPTEWKGFVVRHIQAQPVNEADRLNGTSKRYLVVFSCDAHRSWDSKKNSWGEWCPIGNVLFPAALNIEWKGGKWVAIETMQIKYFSPGPGLSVIAPKPDTKLQGLPPGMTRGK
jgi:hypothetical protein